MVRKIKLITYSFSKHTYLLQAGSYMLQEQFSANITPALPKNDLLDKTISRQATSTFLLATGQYSPPRHTRTHALPRYPLPLTDKNCRKQTKKKAARVNQRDCDRWAKLETALCIWAFFFFFWLGSLENEAFCIQKASFCFKCFPFLKPVRSCVYSAL